MQTDDLNEILAEVKAYQDAQQAANLAAYERNQARELAERAVIESKAIQLVWPALRPFASLTDGETLRIELPNSGIIAHGLTVYRNRVGEVDGCGVFEVEDVQMERGANWWVYRWVFDTDFPDCIGPQVVASNIENLFDAIARAQEVGDSKAQAQADYEEWKAGLAKPIRVQQDPICPLMSSASSEEYDRCKGSGCAWWSFSNSACAMEVLANRR